MSVCVEGVVVSGGDGDGKDNYAIDIDCHSQLQKQNGGMTQCAGASE